MDKKDWLDRACDPHSGSYAPGVGMILAAVVFVLGIGYFAWKVLSF